MKGFTLLEFLISTCIFGLLIGLAVPGFGFYIEKNRSDVASTEIFRAYQFAAQIRSRFAFGKPYTVLRPDGQASFTGSMIYCPHNGEAKNVKRVTWNRVGRPYKGIDRNGDGLIEDTNGKPLIKKG